MTGIEEMLPGIIPQLGPEGLQELGKKVVSAPSAHPVLSAVFICVFMRVPALPGGPAGAGREGGECLCRLRICSVIRLV